VRDTIYMACRNAAPDPLVHCHIHWEAWITFVDDLIGSRHKHRWSPAVTYECANRCGADVLTCKRFSALYTRMPGTNCVPASLSYPVLQIWSRVAGRKMRGCAATRLRSDRRIRAFAKGTWIDFAEGLIDLRKNRRLVGGAIHKAIAGGHVRMRKPV
jgi:hypothetical protein